MVTSTALLGLATIFVYAQTLAFSFTCATASATVKGFDDAAKARAPGVATNEDVALLARRMEVIAIADEVIKL